VVKKYALVASADSFFIVAHPHNAYNCTGVEENVDVETVRRLTYFEAAYSEIWRTQPRACKGMHVICSS
jgi:hypothetical protein